MYVKFARQRFGHLTHSVWLTRIVDIQLGLKWDDRQRALSNRWGFKCTCSLCSASDKQIRKSDARRDRINELRDLALDQVNKQKYRKSLNHHLEIVKLVKEEGLFSHLGESYWVMARLYSALQDRRNTIKYAQMAHAELSRYRESGDDMNETVQELEEFLAGIK